VFMVTFAIFGIVDMFKQLYKLDSMYRETAETSIDEIEVPVELLTATAPKPKKNKAKSVKETEKPDVDFMHKWIKQKSGK
jgi:hypothetical protein